MKCENCGNEHDGSYGSGRFCSKHCSQSFLAKLQNVITLDNMNNGLCNNCSSNNIRQFLISSNLKKNQCEICGLSIWQGKILTVQIHHIDGNKYNNTLLNLIMLCPNCHSQTDTYGFTGLKYNN